VAHLESVNVGVSKPYVGKTGRSGIDKVPAAGLVAVTVPGWGTSGLAGDTIVDKPHHGGPDQAVYA
jgi:MOSC domain-containing protein YiiM